MLRIPALAVVTERATPGALEEGLPLVERLRPEEYHGLGASGSVTVLPDGVVAFSSNAAVYLYDRAEFTRVPVPTTYANAVLGDATGRLWVGGDALVGVIEPDPVTGTPRFISQLDRLPLNQREIGTVASLFRGGDGAMFAVTERGIARFSPDGTARWWSIPNSRYVHLAAIGSQVVYASSPSGISILEENGLRTIVAPGKLPASLTALTKGAPGHVRILTVTGENFDCELATGKLTPAPIPLEGFLRTHRAFVAQPLSDGRLAMILADGGVLIVERDWTRARILNKAQANLGTARVNSMASDGEDGLWLTTSSGLTRLHLGSGVSVFDDRSGLTANGVWDLVRHEGVLFAASVEGLLRLVPSNPADGSPARFVAESSVQNAVNGLLSDEAGLLLGTDRGVSLLPSAGPARTIIETEEAVRCFATFARDPATIYALSDRGLFVLRRTPEGFSSVGPLRRDIAFWSCGEDANGSLWFGTRMHGIVRINPPHDGDWNHADITVFAFGAKGLPAVKGWTAAYSAFGEMQFLADDGTHRWDPATETFPIDERVALDGQHDVRTFPVVMDAEGRAWTSPWHGLVACSRPFGWFDAARAWHDAPPVASSAVGFYGAARMLLDRGPDEILWAKGNNSLVRLDLAALKAAPPPVGWRPVIRNVRASGRTWPLAATPAPAFAYTREPIVFRFSAPRHAPGVGVRYRTRLLGFDADWSEPDGAVEREFTNLSGGPFTFEVQAIDAGGHESPVARYAFSVTPPWYSRPLSFVLYGAVISGAIFAFIRWRLARSARNQRRLEALVVTRTSELATARDAAEAANRAKSAFLASMSHELRTPLNGVIGYSQVLQNDDRLAPDQQERLRIVQSSGEHLLRMINDVLDLAKIEAGKVTLRLAPCALGDLLRDISAAHANAAEAKGLAFGLDLAPALPAWVDCDAQKLRQVLDNLLGNAVKFTRAGRITLAVRRAADTRIEFSIHDTGQGISPADQARLFQAFEQAHDSRPDAPGAGLGLAISRALVERLGGTLTLASASGSGSTFSFTIPLPEVSPGVSVVTGRRLAGYTGTPRRVLIVDDHEINRRLLVDLLTPLGFACVEYQAARTALERLGSGVEPWPDLAIVDVRMDDLDGLDFTRSLRALPRGPQLKVLLMSASVLSFDLKDGRRAGADDFIAKPFHTTDFLERVGHLLTLEWRYADSATASARTSALGPLPAGMREALREHLAHGDLDAFRAKLNTFRVAHPTAVLDALNEAAARFDLPRLRALLG